MGLSPSPTPISDSLLANLRRQVPLDRADFGFWIDAIGESYTLVDERGRIVDDEELTRLLGSVDELGQLAGHSGIDGNLSSDALYCLALLLTALSRTDRALSAILDGLQTVPGLATEHTEGAEWRIIRRLTQRRADR